MKALDLLSLAPEELVSALTGAQVTYRRCTTASAKAEARKHGRESHECDRHLLIERVRTAGEVGPWCVQRCNGNENAPAIYTAKSGDVCVSCVTETLHGNRMIDDRCEHRTLYVENIRPYKK